MPEDTDSQRTIGSFESDVVGLPATGASVLQGAADIFNGASKNFPIGTNKMIGWTIFLIAGLKGYDWFSRAFDSKVMGFIAAMAVAGALALAGADMHQGHIDKLRNPGARPDPDRDNPDRAALRDDNQNPDNSSRDRDNENERSNPPPAPTPAFKP